MFLDPDGDPTAVENLGRQHDASGQGDRPVDLHARASPTRSGQSTEHRSLQDDQPLTRNQNALCLRQGRSGSEMTTKACSPPPACEWLG